MEPPKKPKGRVKLVVGLNDPDRCFFFFPNACVEAGREEEMERIIQILLRKRKCRSSVFEEAFELGWFDNFSKKTTGTAWGVSGGELMSLLW